MHFRLYISVLTFTAISLLMGIGTLIYVADPYGEFNHSHTGMRSFQASPLITHSHFEKLRDKRYALVFGTSHISIVSDKYFNSPILTFHALYGNPLSVADFLDALGPAQIKNIAEIFFLLDIHVYDEDTYVPVETYINPINRLLYRARRIGPSVLSSLDKIYKNISGRYSSFIDENGRTVVLEEKNLCDIPVRKTAGSVQDVDSKAQAALSRIVSFGTDNAIKTTFASPAMYKTYLDTLDAETLLRQKQKLISAVGEYHDFVFYGGPLENCDLYSDPRHLNTYGIDHYMQIIRSGTLLTRTPRPVK